MSVLAARDLTRTYLLHGQQVEALRGVSLDVAPGEYVAITGPSGCGKSTLLQLAGGIDTPTAGTVSVLGTRLDQLDDRKLTRLRLHQIGFVFQRFHLLPVLTALENVELPMAEAGVPRRERLERAHELLRYVGLDRRERHRATQLSGGELPGPFGRTSGTSLSPAKVDVEIMHVLVGLLLQALRVWWLASAARQGEPW